MPDIEARKETSESVKSMGERKSIKCEKCNHVMNFKNELTVDKKVALKLVVFLLCFLINNQIQI